MDEESFAAPPPPPPPSIPTNGNARGHPHRLFVSRGGVKLEAALLHFAVPVQGKICADLGANVGGFTDCLLQFGAAKVYAVDTAYGTLAWELRKNPRVIVRERVNALHVQFPEPIQLIVIDVGWTRQERILPVAAAMLAPDGEVLTLVKPHYESEEARSQRGVLDGRQARMVLDGVIVRIRSAGWDVRNMMQSPIEGQKGNIEYIVRLWRAPGIA